MHKLFFVALLLSIANRVYATQDDFQVEVTELHSSTSRSTDLGTNEEPLEVMSVESPQPSILNVLNRQDLRCHEDEIWESFFKSDLDELMEISPPVSPICIIEPLVDSNGDSLSECTLVPDLLFHIIGLAYGFEHNTPFVCKLFKDHVYNIRSQKVKTYAAIMPTCHQWRMDWLMNQSLLPIPSFIKYLDLAGLGFTDRDANSFAGLHNVISLNLSLNSIGDNTATVLSMLPNLNHLTIRKTLITTHGLSVLQSKFSLMIEHDIGMLCPPSISKKQTYSVRSYAQTVETSRKKQKRF